MRLKSLPVFFLLLVLPCFSLSAIEVATSDWETLKSILTTLKTDNAKLASLLTESKADLTQARLDLERSMLDLTEAQAELKTLRKSLSGMESSLTKLKESLASIETGTWWKIALSTGAGFIVGIITKTVLP